MDEPTDFKDDLRQALTAKSEPEAVEPEVVAGPEVAAEPAVAPEPAVEAKVEPAEPVEQEISVRELFDAQRIDGQVQPPEHWTIEDKAFFNNLPDDTARERVLGWRVSVEKGAQEKFTAAADIRKAAEAYDVALAPLADVIAAANIDKPEAIKRLVAAEQLLRNDPVTGFTTLVTQYGARIAGTEQAKQFIQQMAQALRVEAGPLIPSEALTSDPTAARIAELEGKLASFESSRQADIERQHATVVTDAQAKLEAFTTARAADGTLLYPHFEAVRKDMAGLMMVAAQANAPIELPDAYARAVWSRTDLRDGLMKAQQEQATKDAAAANRTSLDKARSARTPRSSSVPVAEPDISQEPQRDTIKRVMRELAGGGRV